MNYRVHLDKKGIWADWEMPLRTDFDSDGLTFSQENEVFKQFLKEYNHRPHYPISKELLEIWVDGQIVKEGVDFRLEEIENDIGPSGHTAYPTFTTTAVAGKDWKIFIDNAINFSSDELNEEINKIRSKLRG